MYRCSCMTVREARYLWLFMCCFLLLFGSIGSDECGSGSVGWCSFPGSWYGQSNPVRREKEAWPSHTVCVYGSTQAGSGECPLAMGALYRRGRAESANGESKRGGRGSLLSIPLHRAGKHCVTC